ncbi:cytochrome-c peroxidase [Methylobacterium nodulans]|uniref:Di-heme cytochrome c peroxidase n=1 Tax=Methylobacterium nodulans (strain LMG 21967 / CNCM I-2342 / ORS 2060) TaxID=460265 RepID=B8IH50_METNO|nr:cytochrome c peroxidase [Methylobacterium nodulans]ACL59742.1 Di-heme cytochrome c peroxidase [Methylobacterium nodulans ORS 2060]
MRCTCSLRWAAFSLAAAIMVGVLPSGGQGPEVAADLRRAYSGPPENWPAPWIEAGVAFVELGARVLPPVPDRTGQRRAALGARLFHDPVLSADQHLACAGCHDPAHGWSIPAPKARGHRDRLGRRNPPGLQTAAARSQWGWDGRRQSLVWQVLAPLTDPDEMGNPSLEPILGRLAADAGYAARFTDAFPAAGLSADTLSAALLAYLAGLDRPTRFDRFAAGDLAALSDRAIAGLHLFRTKARCANCHFGPLLTDERFHNLKLSSFGEPAQDLGRFEVTGRPEDAGRFRTPSLRHLRDTAPYGHAGLFATLAGVVNLYDRGGGEVWARNAAEAARPLHADAARLSPLIRPLGLTRDEKAALVAFLRTL